MGTIKGYYIKDLVLLCLILFLYWPFSFYCPTDTFLKVFVEITWPLNFNFIFLALIINIFLNHQKVPKKNIYLNLFLRKEKRKVRLRDQDWRIKIEGSRLKDQDSGIKIQGLRLRAQHWGIKIESSIKRDQDWRIKIEGSRLRD